MAIFTHGERKPRFRFAAAADGVHNSSVEAPNVKELLKQLPTPKGISVEEAADLIGYSVSATREMCENGEIVAWRWERMGKDGKTIPARKWKVDEVVLKIMIALRVARARRENINLHEALKQGLFKFS